MLGLGWCDRVRVRARARVSVRVRARVRVKVRALLSPHCHWDRREAVQQSSGRVEHRVIFLPADRLEVVFLVGGLRMRGRG